MRQARTASSTRWTLRIRRFAPRSFAHCPAPVQGFVHVRSLPSGLQACTRLRHITAPDLDFSSEASIVGRGQGQAATAAAAPETNRADSNPQSRKRSLHPGHDSLQDPDMLDDQRPLKQQVGALHEAGNTAARKRSWPHDPSPESLAEDSAPKKVEPLALLNALDRSHCSSRNFLSQWM
jgi:hypothetical protein